MNNLVEQTDVVEDAPWSSVGALQARELLLRRLATVAQATGDLSQAEAGRRAADRVRARALQLSKAAPQEQPSGDD